MDIKTILVPFSGDKREFPALSTAFALGKDFASHITCLHVSTDPKHIAYAGGFGFAGSTLENFTDDITAANQLQAHNAQLTFAEYERKNHITNDQGATTPLHASATFRYEIGRIDKIITHHGRLSDLIVMGRTISEVNPDYATVATTALFDTGRPVLFTPPKALKTVGYNIAIAWNSSAESSRVITCAMPLLHQARNVFIFTIREGGTNSATSARELAKYLKLHGITAKSLVIKKQKLSVGEIILNKAKKLEVDLLVMGAFTHNRVRQMIVGGATSHILENSPIPVFMAH